jgi:ATP-dependent RNA helicase RhlE
MCKNGDFEDGAGCDTWGRAVGFPIRSRDPFFDKPYEPPPVSGDQATPSWEASARPASTRGISANIKSKRKIAALFKAD